MKISIESNVRSYCRVFPAVFSRGTGAVLMDDHDNEWLDFLSGAGALNYGHNHPILKQALLRYIEQNGVVSSLDLTTTAKLDFLGALSSLLLKPRGLNYRCQFCGPTGTSAVEAALRLARKVTGRKGIVSFSNSYHGMSSGAMSVSASGRYRQNQYLNADWITFFPFDGFSGLDNELEFMRAMLMGVGSGIGRPAAFILELVQGEGGVNIASTQWVRQVHSLARELGALFIVDEIQSGCGRTGRFFSFEHHDLSPDIICVSKSISGLGLPMALLLIAPDLDVWEPGEHIGTFRGFNYSFVTAAETLRQFWADPVFIDTLGIRSEQLSVLLSEIKRDLPDRVQHFSHLGMIAGLRTGSAAYASAVQNKCFVNGLIVETCGPDAATIKLLPPINIGAVELERGVAVLQDALRTTNV